MGGESCCETHEEARTGQAHLGVADHQDLQSALARKAMQTRTGQMRMESCLDCTGIGTVHPASRGLECRLMCGGVQGLLVEMSCSIKDEAAGVEAAVEVEEADNLTLRR